LRVDRRVTVANDLTLFAWTLSLYLGIVYIFSFSQNLESARYANHIAILMMDLVMLASLLRDRPSFGHWFRSGHENRWYLRLVGLIAWATLLLVGLLHADYLLTRYSGAERGRFGTLNAIKGYLVFCQVGFISLFYLARATGEFRVSVSELVKTKSRDLFLFSPVVVPLINYFSRNRADFTFFTAIEYFFVFSMLPIVALLYVQVLQRVLLARAFAAPVVVGLTLLHYSMPMVSAVLKRPVELLFPLQLALSIIVPGVLAVMYAVDKAALVKALLFFSVSSAAGSFALAESLHPPVRDGQRTRNKPGVVADRESTPLSRLLKTPIKRPPDVYLLVYDGYASTAMLSRYGINNDSITHYLRENDFTSYEQAYSLFLASLGSMSSLLDMRAPAEASIGGSNTGITFFKEQGYRTNLILNSYLLKGPDRIVADFVFPSMTFRSGLSALYRGIGGGEFKSEIVFQDSDRDEWVLAKRQVLAEKSSQPKMLYAHSAFPGHSQNSGRCLEDETHQYNMRLTIANEEIRGDVEAILSTDRDAIIVVAGDHGPFLTGDCYYMTRYREDDLSAQHLADRYSARLAIRWPDGAFAAYDKISTIQDVLFSIAAYLLQDASVLQYRPSSETFGYGGIPDGAVKDGVVMIGKDKGQRLP
jgi:hypothetical protein